MLFNEYEDEESAILDSWDADFFTDTSLGVSDDFQGVLRPRGFHDEADYDEDQSTWY